MTAKELKNKIADPDGNFRKWGAFWGAVLTPIVMALYSYIKEPATRQDAEMVDKKINRIDSMVQYLVIKEDITQKQDEHAHNTINSRIDTINLKLLTLKK